MSLAMFCSIVSSRTGETPCKPRTHLRQDTFTTYLQDKLKSSICRLLIPNHCRESSQPSSGAYCFRKVRLDDFFSRYMLRCAHFWTCQIIRTVYLVRVCGFHFPYTPQSSTQITNSIMAYNIQQNITTPHCCLTLIGFKAWPFYCKNLSFWWQIFCMTLCIFGNLA